MTARGPKTKLNLQTIYPAFVQAVAEGQAVLEGVAHVRARFAYYRAWTQSPWGATHSLTILMRPVGPEPTRIHLIVRKGKKK